MSDLELILANIIYVGIFAISLAGEIYRWWEARHYDEWQRIDKHRQVRK